MKAGANRRGRKPDPAVDAAIRHAVVEMLFERGFEMTVDEVAARAGVGRASVFRRFPTKRDMILDTVTQMTVAQIEVPDTGSLRDDLVGAVREVMRLFDRPPLRPLARRFLGEACRDPVFADVLRANLDRRLEIFRVILDRGVARGELPATADPALLADLVSGLVAVRLATEMPLPGHGRSPDTEEAADSDQAAEPDETDKSERDEVAALVDGLLYGFATGTTGFR